MNPYRFASSPVVQVVDPILVIANAIRIQVIICAKSIRHLKMRERHDRLDPVLQQLIKKMIVKDEACFIRQFLVPLRKNPAPGDGSPEALKAQFRKKPDVIPSGCLSPRVPMYFLILP